MYAKDRFGVLLAYGVVMLIFWQAVINLFMIMGFLPVVGIPLPLVSYGGSSLMTTMLGLGLLMNVRMRRFQSSMGQGVAVESIQLFVLQHQRPQTLNKERIGIERGTSV